MTHKNCQIHVSGSFSAVPCFRIWGHFPPFRVLGFGVIFRHSAIPPFRRSAVPPFRLLGSPCSCASFKHRNPIFRRHTTRNEGACIVNRQRDHSCLKKETSNHQAQDQKESICITKYKCRLSLKWVFPL